MLAAVLGVPGGLPAGQGAVQPAPPLGRAGEARPGGGGVGGTPRKASVGAAWRGAGGRRAPQPGRAPLRAAEQEGLSWHAQAQRGMGAESCFCPNPHY